MKHLLVVGSSGVIGSAVIASASALPDWQVYAVSRRPPQVEHGLTFTHMPLDLTDKKACAEALGPLAKTLTHVVYAAVAESPGLVGGWSDTRLMQRNLCMLENVLGPLSRSETLRHVTVLQGTKAYGAHLHPVSLPLVESAPRDLHENFYWLQEDFLRATCDRQGWSWTILRPQIVLGGACGVAMNPIPVIGAYLALCLEEGDNCGFPGAHVGIWEAVDARLVAEACLWAASAPQARNEIFNLTNGDIWVPGHQWPEICALWGMKPGAPRVVDFAHFVEDKAAAWERLVRKYALRSISLRDLAGESHHYLNLILCNGQAAAPWPPALASTIKIRQAGFGTCFDTMQSLRHWFEWLTRQRILPSPKAMAAGEARPADANHAAIG